ncbi:GNAT family N-acetyltransferase [Bradyrhizobium canariense]|uniref:GNAT family N-acetyltransferase n=1 Tax=Bradyrhizobium canariense TaxID=255045 RepID=UPI0032DF9655
MALSDLAYAGIFYHLLLAGLAHVAIRKPSGALPAMVGLALLATSFVTQNAAREVPSPYVHVAIFRHILVDGTDEIEIAYTFKRSLWGQGLASETAAALTSIGLSQLELPSLIGLAFVGNGASRRVLEKSNYVLEKSTTHHGEDVVIYRARR